jgi:hypothetical protein
VANRTRHGTMRPANCTSQINQLFIYRPLALDVSRVANDSRFTTNDLRL